MSSDFFPALSYESPADLNREINELYEEVEALHDETGMLLGLMAGSFAFFVKRLIDAHQTGEAIAPDTCEKLVVEALKRVLSTQQRFDYDLITEIRDTLNRMDPAGSLSPYLDKAVQARKDLS